MTIVIPIMRIVLQMKIIARCPKNILSFITLLYKGQQGQKDIKSFKTTLHRSLLNNIETILVYTRAKLGSNFQTGKC